MTLEDSKQSKLKKHWHFLRVYQQGQDHRGKYLVLHIYLNTKHPYSKLGISASKYFGNAPQRNRFKRISREAFRQIRKAFPRGFEMVIKPRKHALYASMQDILEEILTLSKDYLKESVTSDVSQVLSEKI